MQYTIQISVLKKCLINIHVNKSVYQSIESCFHIHPMSFECRKSVNLIEIEPFRIDFKDNCAGDLSDLVNHSHVKSQRAVDVCNFRLQPWNQLHNSMITDR